SRRFVASVSPAQALLEPSPIRGADGLRGAAGDDGVDAGQVIDGPLCLASVGDELPEALGGIVQLHGSPLDTWSERSWDRTILNGESAGAGRWRGLRRGRARIRWRRCRSSRRSRGAIEC